MTSAFANMTTELAYLGWTCVLIVVQLLLQAGSSSLDKGLPYAMGPQDDAKPLKSVTAGRLKRAFANLLETFPLFATLALALTITNRGGGTAALGAALYFWCRVAYVPIYALGVPVLRTLIWAGSLVGLVLMLLRLMG